MSAPSVTHTVVWSSKNGRWSLIHVVNTHDTPPHDYYRLDNNVTGECDYPYHDLSPYTAHIMWMTRPEIIPAYVKEAVARHLVK